MKTDNGIYGALALREIYKKYITDGLLIACLIHLAVIGSYNVYSQMSDHVLKFPPRIPVRRINIIPLPPPINNTWVAPRISAPSATVPSVGVPIPIPDDKINYEQTIADQLQMSAMLLTGNEIGDPIGSTVTIADGTTIGGEEEPPGNFVPMEKMPVPVKSVYPQYPEIARRAGIEGTVTVRMWVTKEGTVKKAEIVRSDIDLFNQVSLDAAVQWMFTPAIMNNGPVSVWITVPFRFRLNK